MDEPKAEQRASMDASTEDLTEYRPLSTLAVLGLVAGMAAPLAFASGWFAFAPAAGVILSIAAIRGIRRNPDATSGIGLAASGLTLSAVVLGAVLTRDALAPSLHVDSARPTADRFVSLLGEGDLVGAFELTRAFPNRELTPESAAARYEGDLAARESLDEFGDKPSVKRILAAAEMPEFVEVLSMERKRSGRHTIALAYRLTGSADGTPVDFAVRLARSSAGAFRSAWRVTSCDLARSAR